MKKLTFDEAEELAKRCDYAFEAKGESPINWGDATGFFLEGYNYAFDELYKEYLKNKEKEQ